MKQLKELDVSKNKITAINEFISAEVVNFSDNLIN